MNQLEMFSKFIESLNSMDLKGADLYKQYSIMKNAQKVLGERIEELGGMIKEEMEGLGVQKQQFDFGGFTISTRKTWEYSHSVKELEESVRIQKKAEEEHGVAVCKETKSLIFR